MDRFYRHVGAFDVPADAGNRRRQACGCGKRYLNTALLGVIAALLLALAVFQGINTFHPKAAAPTGVQQVVAQKQTVKPETAAEIKDTINSAQAALNQEQVPKAYKNAVRDYFDDLK